MKGGCVVMMALAGMLGGVCLGAQKDAGVPAAEQQGKPAATQPANPAAEKAAGPAKKKAAKSAAKAKRPLQPPTQEEIAQITQAVPAKAEAAPAKPRRLLVFYKCEGAVHAVIPATNKALEIMGQKTGAFTADFSEDMAVFTAQNLAPYDAVALNNTTRLKFEDPEARKALLDFVRNGKGLIGFHAAADNFYEWPQGAEMIGGQFDGHPWRGGGTWAVKNDEPDHPLNRGFEGKGFSISDELYQYKGAYSRDTLRVLLSVDLSDPATAQVSGQKRADRDNGLSWIRPYGKGRVFYCALGHNKPLLWNRAILSHYLAGIQYALGDFKVDDSPRPPAKADSGGKPAAPPPAGK